jgi:GNAT superfamily N-acetyltransferase
VKIIDLKHSPEHISLLANWHHEQWSYLNPGKSLQKRIDDMQGYLNDTFIPTMYVAMIDSVPIGSAAIVALDMDIRLDLTPWLASVYVVPKHRNRGFGSALVAHVMRRAKRQGVKRLYLFTPDQEHFYVHLGWKRLEKVSYRGTEVTIMSAPLN